MLDYTLIFEKWGTDMYTNTYKWAAEVRMLTSEIFISKENYIVRDVTKST